MREWSGRREGGWIALYEGRIDSVHNVNVTDASCMANCVQTEVYDGRCLGRVPWCMRRSVLRRRL